jgi:hypothetical protein
MTAYTQATLVGCWAHARRKFIEADITQGKGKSGKAKLAVNFIKKLYRIEMKSLCDRIHLMSLMGLYVV